ncbi:hypothetical protein B0H13DRAFT_2291697 [Mycena leptocephala]|nr:hypothetical protein B0H13DRAFT_2291697 [Mycena leptocephala]
MRAEERGRRGRRRPARTKDLLAATATDMNTSSGGEHISTFHAAPSGCALPPNTQCHLRVRQSEFTEREEERWEAGQEQREGARSRQHANGLTPLIIDYLPSTPRQKSDRNSKTHLVTPLHHRKPKNRKNLSVRKTAYKVHPQHRATCAKRRAAIPPLSIRETAAPMIHARTQGQPVRRSAWCLSELSPCCWLGFQSRGWSYKLTN